MKKVFLGGTCNGSTWREDLIEKLEIDFYNPVVEDWTVDCMDEEIRQREICDYCVYVIIPKMTGVYSIAEVVDDSNKRPEKTIFCVLDKDEDNIHSRGLIEHLTYQHAGFTMSQMKSLKQVGKMVKTNGGKYFTSLDDVAEYLNSGL